MNTIKEYASTIDVKLVMQFIGPFVVIVVGVWSFLFDTKRENDFREQIAGPVKKKPKRRKKEPIALSSKQILGTRNA